MSHPQDLSLREQAAAVASGELGAAELLDATFARIEVDLRPDCGQVRVDERSQLRPVDPVGDSHDSQLGFVDVVAERFEACTDMSLERVDWRSVTAAPTTLCC